MFSNIKDIILLFSVYASLSILLYDVCMYALLCIIVAYIYAALIYEVITLFIRMSHCGIHYLGLFVNACLSTYLKLCCVNSFIIVCLVTFS